MRGKARTSVPAPEAGHCDELQQVGVLPWRLRRDGEPKMLLITSRRRGRWIVPKGWPMKGRSAAAAASREAFEEAGIIGDISPSPVTSYRYWKALDDGSEVSCRVTVFGMKVRGTLSHWREKGQRQRRWFSLTAAAERLDDTELAAFVRSLDASSEALRSLGPLAGWTYPPGEPQTGER
ncbi:NUDIX hydrolase [Shinella sp.]|nr:MULTISPECIES: NUDIX hydrolase [unclassified Shinella]MCO5151129.1 NUDIX hydrolase [Shinella sp.]MDC7265978.1 NUDIX hydrolase [Shinella sp. HY16]MDC7272875.1 NUDIX hydrolase [Shinella sp. YZ44]